MENDIYLTGQYQNIMGTGVLSKVWMYIHKVIEKPYSKMHFQRIVEFGAGGGEHLKYVQSGYETYFATDIRIDPLSRIAGLKNVVVETQNIEQTKYLDASFDRVIVTCVLAHVTDPVKALAEIHRITNQGGFLSIYLPCEPGILLRLARRFSTIPKNKRLKIQDPYFEHFLEHKNYYLALNHFILREFSRNKIKTRFYPFPFLSWNLNLFKIYQIEISETSNL